MLYYLLVVLSIGLIIFIHEFGHFIVARLTKMTVLKFSLGFGPPLISFQKNETCYQVGVLPLGGFVQIKEMLQTKEHIKKPPFYRLLTIIAGPCMNLLAALAVFTLLYIWVGVPVPSFRPEIGRIDKGSPADKAGLLSGDIVLKVNQRSIKKWQELSLVIQQNPKNPLHILVKRGKSRISLIVTPKPVPPEFKGSLGIHPRLKYIKLGFFSALLGGVFYTLQVSWALLKKVRDIIMKETKEKVIGPIGIIDIGAKEIQKGKKDFFYLIALLNICLFLFNFLPLPALDGGRAVFLLYEIIVGKGVNPRIESLVHTIGIILIFGFLIFISLRDILRFF
jgi:regulator of sigma E protease